MFSKCCGGIYFDLFNVSILLFFGDSSFLILIFSSKTSKFDASIFDRNEHETPENEQDDLMNIFE